MNKNPFLFFFQLNGELNGSTSSPASSATPPEEDEEAEEADSAVLEINPSSLCQPNEQATMTDPDRLGPCEPGTAVKLQGVVWQESDRGELVYQWASRVISRA